jgi:C4-dicarboxylate-specific signal transduction histidine kinase
MHQLEVAHISRVNSIGEMASSLSHEINQPLFVMQAQAERSAKLLKAGSENIDIAIDKMHIIIKQAERANKILSRIRAHVHKGATSKQVVSLNALVNNSLELLQSEIRKKNIKLQLDLSKSILDVNVDPVQVEQVIINLINNSIDALNEIPEDERHLLLKTAEVQGSANLRISDSGAGMDPVEVGAAFDSFYSTKSDGLGVGLSISRSIIESLGGRIGLEVNDSGGMTSYFSLPIYRIN